MKKEDFDKMKKMTEGFYLSDWFDTNVDVFLDEASGKAYQVDGKHGRYREADGRTAGQYGEWKKIEATR